MVSEKRAFYLPPIFGEGRVRMRVRVGALLCLGAFVLGWYCLGRLQAQSDLLKPVGWTYDQLQRSGDQLDGHIARILEKDDAQRALTDAVWWDLAFTACYGVFGWLLGGLLATFAQWNRNDSDWARRWGTRAFLAAGWAVLVAALLDQTENTLLLLAAHNRGPFGSVISVADPLKWDMVKVALPLLVAGAVLSWSLVPQLITYLPDLEDRVAKRIPGPWWIKVVVTWLVYVLAIVVLVWGSQAGTLGVAVAAASFTFVAATAALVVLRSGIDDESGTDAEKSKRRRIRMTISVAMTMVGVVLCGLWAVGGHPSGFLLAGIGTLYFGGAELLAELSQDGPPQLWRRLLTICGVTVVGGVVLAVLGAPFGATMVVAGLLLLPAGVYLGSQKLISQSSVADEARDRRTVRVWIGAGAAAAGVGLLGIAGVPWLYAVLLGAALLLLVGFVSSNSRADVVAIACFLTVLGAAHGDGTLPVELDPQPGDDVVVAFGDSYTSGEGTGAFLDGTNVRHDNECRRSPLAYPAILGSTGDQPELHRAQDQPGITVNGATLNRTVFVACSGAVAEEVYRRAQYKGDPINGQPLVGTSPSGLNQLAHWRFLKEQLHLEPRLVVIGIGGNDSLFGDVGKTCLLPGDCSEVSGYFLRGLDKADESTVGQDSVERKVGLAFDELKKEFPDIPVLVVPYPVPMGNDPCTDVTVLENERDFVIKYSTRLDDAVRRAAQDHRFHYVKDAKYALINRQHALCQAGSEQAGLNFVAASPIVGSAEDSLNPTTWGHDTLHPNSIGHRDVRDAIRTWLAAHTANGALPVEADAKEVLENEADADRAGAYVEAHGSAGEHFCDGREDTCGDAKSSWVTGALLGVWWVLLPLALVLVGSWFVWLGVLSWVRRQRAVAP